MKTIYVQTALLLIMVILVAISCASPDAGKKKIIYINSYHHGHPSSDEIMEAVIEKFPKDSFRVRSYYMDTKRQPSMEHITNISAQLYDSILDFNPDILIVSDDNAVKYIVKPNMDRLAMPVVFCGVNGSDKEYNLPAEKVTGMLEVLPIEETILALRPYYPHMHSLLVLTENTTTSKKEVPMLDSMFTRLGLKTSYALVDDFEEWKIKFIEANHTHDIIYMVTHGAIKNWNHEEALQLIDQNINIPVVTCEDFIMPYAVFGLTKVAKEQGDWAATTAKKILDGMNPQDFSVTKNSLYTTWLNEDLAIKIGFNPDTSSFQNFKILKY